jgi:hypothetical protein
MLESATSKQIADRSRPRIDLGDVDGIFTCALGRVHRAIGPVACLLQTGGECVRIDVCDSDTDCCSHHGVRGRANVSCSARASISVMVAVAKSIRSMTDAEVRTATRRACGVGGDSSAALVWSGRCTQTGGPGIIALELAGGEQRATELLELWGPTGAAAARTSLWLDFGYMCTDGAGCPTGSRPARVRIARTGGGPDEVRHVVRPTCVVGDLAHSPANTRRLNIQRLDGFAQIESKWGRTMGQSARATIRQCRQCDRYRLPLSRRASTTG